MTNTETQKCILVVEDEVLIAMELEDLLQDLGHQPTVVHTLKDARVQLGQQAFDAVLTDGNLGGPNDGKELVKHLLSQKFAGPIIAYSAQPDWDEFADVPTFAHVRKPDYQGLTSIITTIGATAPRANA